MTTLASNALTTLEALREYLQSSTSLAKHDDLLRRLINSVSDAIEQECNRTFGAGSVTEAVTGTGRALLAVKKTPVTEITSVTVDDTLVAAADYSIYDANAGHLYKEGGWSAPSDGVKKNISVVYTGGYVLPKDDATLTPRTLPYAVEQACLMWAMFMYKSDVASFSSTILETGLVLRPTRIPPQVEYLLRPYKWVIV